MRHFLTRGEHKEQVAMCPQGPKRVSLFMSEHTIHSSKVSESLLIIEGLREPTWPLIKQSMSNQAHPNTLKNLFFLTKQSVTVHIKNQIILNIKCQQHYIKPFFYFLFYSYLFIFTSLLFKIINQKVLNA